MIVVVAGTGEQVGELTIGPEGVTGEGSVARSMAEAYMFRLSQPYDQGQARAYWENWSNGYYTVRVSPSNP